MLSPRLGIRTVKGPDVQPLRRELGMRRSRTKKDQQRGSNKVFKVARAIHVLAVLIE